MDNIWTTTLLRAGALFAQEQSTILHFGNPVAELEAARNGNIFSDLAQYRLVRFSGEDAQQFLSNLLSSDVRKLQIGECQYSTFSTPKGRMLASMLLVRTATDYLLLMPADIAGPIQRKLSMYILRSKVKASPQSTDEILLGIAGTGATQALADQFGVQTDSNMQAKIVDETILISLDQQCWIVLTSPENATAMYGKLKSHSFVAAGSNAWNWRWIQRGFAWIYNETQEQFVAQMANMECLGAVSFSKGCYPGQEIVARTQYLGKLKRRMSLVHIDTDLNNAKRGTSLYSRELPGQAIGMIADVASAPDGGVDALAVVQSSCWAHGVALGSEAGPQLHAKPLPYAIVDPQ